MLLPNLQATTVAISNITIFVDGRKETTIVVESMDGGVATKNSNQLGADELRPISFELTATDNEVTDDEASCCGIDGPSTAEMTLDTWESNKVKALPAALKDAYVHPVLKALGHGVINELKTLTRPVKHPPNLAVLFSMEGMSSK
jgi:hypothetical protein